MVRGAAGAGRRIDRQQGKKDREMTAKSSKQAPNQAAAGTEDFVSASQEALQNFVKVGAESYEKAFENARDKAEEVVRGYDDLALTSKENVDALVAAGTAYGKGLEAMSGEFMGFAKQMLEENVKVTKAVLGAKSLHEAMDLQASYTRQSLDSLMSQGTRVGELATKVAQETAEPINTRVTTVVQKWSNIAA
jgi:phasin family protein